MTDAPEPTTAPPAAAGETPAPLAPNTLGLVGLILGGVGFLLAVIPPTSGFAWLLLIPAIVLGIIGLTRKGKKKGTSLAALILGIVGWLISIIVFFVSAALFIGDTIGTTDTPPAISSPDDSGDGDESAPEVAGIGDTVTSGEGVSFTVNSVTCGIPSVDTGLETEPAKGEFCEVAFTIENGTNDSLNISSYELTANIGDAEYETNSLANKFDGEYFGTDINPGLSADGVVYFDVAVGAGLDTVTYAQLLSFDEKLVVDVS